MSHSLKMMLFSAAKPVLRAVYRQTRGMTLGTLLTLEIRQGLLVQGIGLETLNIALGVILLLALSAPRIREGIANIFRKGNPS